MEEESKIKNLEVNNIPIKTSIQKEPIMEGELTGYPSIDKPWLKFYGEEAKKTTIPEQTVYEFIKSQNEKNLNRCALNFFGNKIEYSEMFRRIEDTAKALKLMGVEKGDVVTLCLPTLPESIYLFYALNKLGAVANFVDPRTNSDRIKYFVKITDSKLLVAIDLIYDKVKEIPGDSNAKKIVLVSVNDSFPWGLNLLYNLKAFANLLKKTDKLDKKSFKDSVISWKEFIKFGKNLKEIEPEKFQKNTPVAMVLTGGTTGLPKAVILSNENLNVMSIQYEYTGIPHDENTNKFLDIMPPFLAYGLVNGIHMPLSLGMQNIIIPKFDPDKFDDLILKYKPNHFMGVPTHYEKLIDSPKMKGSDLSFLVTAGAGGDSISTQLEQKINSFLYEHNCRVKMQKGYGMTEFSSAICSTLSNECNKIGSVGVPLLKSTISIFEPETDIELKYGEQGEICITGPTMMLGYLNNTEEYNNIVKIHNDGNKWIHSGDLGYMDEEGFLYVLGRRKRMIIRPDGHNVFPGAIENVILSNDKVANCAVIGVSSEYNTQGKYPKAFISLNDEIKNNIDEAEFVRELDELCWKNFPERDVPYYYEFIDKIPLTDVGKIDYKKLEEISSDNCYKSAKYMIDFGNNKTLVKK